MRKIRPELFSSYHFLELVDEYVQGETNKKILTMFYVEEKTQEEIEYEIHVSVSTVKRVCKRYGIPIFRLMNREP